ncbi:hypothetical protein E0Z10_g4249 [Xylaria hypoxylon]|uniref:Uncharacterized protein n=1 Tax=Xylaria hypoxylon TaxID=37992 RepID=A0A4Z0YYH9_9PEZI|nr:hypothetical protein E0Z10_g4249 [Xylaria hypoxylon]
MSASRHSRVTQREVLRSRYEDQGSIMYRAQGTQGSISDFRTFDVNLSLHDSPVHRQRKYRPSHVLDYSSSSQRDDLALCSDPNTHRFRPSPELVPLDTERLRGRKFKPQDESSQVQRSWVKTPTLSRSSTPESLGPIKPSSSQGIHEKAVRFSDKVYLDASSLERSYDALGHRKDPRRGQSEDYLTRASGNGEISGEIRYYGGYNKTLPKRLHTGERQRGHLPPAPVIPRLPTPDFESGSHYEISLAKYDFCPCCSSDGRDEEDGVRWKKGKAKMDEQVDHARAYISRMTMSERLITDA